MEMIALAFIIVLVSSSAFAWDGYDSESGGYVEIGKGNLVRSGQTIDVYDHNAGEYRDVDVVGIRDAGGSVEVEVYDDEAGEYRTLDMEKD